MSRKPLCKFVGSISLIALLFLFFSCSDSRKNGTSNPPNGPGAPTGPNPAPGAPSSGPRFLYFATGAEPAGAPIDQNGMPGAVQKFINPDAGVRGMGIVAANPAGTFLYVTESEDTGSGSFFIVQYSIDQSSSALTPVNTFPVANSGAIAVDPTGNVLALGGSTVSNPDAAKPVLALYKIAGDGSLTPGGTPVPVFGQRVINLIFDASGENLFVLSNQAEPATPGSALQAFRVDAATGSATLVQSIPLSIDANEIAVVDSKFVYLSGVGAPTGSIAGYSVQSDGSLAPITGTPFGASTNAFGLAAAPNGSMLYATDLFKQRLSRFSVGSDGTLTLVGSTADNTFDPAALPSHLVVDRSGKYVYGDACNPNAPPPGCEPALWGGTIASDGSVTPMNGTPFSVPVYQFDLVY